MTEAVQLVIVGSVGLDTVETPFEKHEEILGGSVSYACASAALFCKTGMVGIAGEDFPQACLDLYNRFGIDTVGLRQVPGKTFRWSGVYDADMIDRRTLSTELNVFEGFSPELPESYKQAPFVLLGNISPALQLHVLDQTRNARLVAADTMDLWINTARKDLDEVISRVAFLTLNDSEARLLTGKHHLRECASLILDMGPRYVAIKRGEHGAMLFARDGIFMVPAYPVESVRDPTGAGDTFAGGFMGFLARQGDTCWAAVKRALIVGAVVASFGVEDFSLDGLQGLTRERVDARLDELAGMTRVE